ncbi:glutamate--tRNA ligase [soil metagenome]
MHDDSVVRTRIEPAPSGSIHVGNARTALYSWLFARQHGGSFILRIADTDLKRVTDENYRAVLEDMRWLGLDWDEGPEVGGAFGPYRQSERFERYRATVTALLEAGHAYPCYCTTEEVAGRGAAAKRKTPGYDGFCRDLDDAGRAAFEEEGRRPAVRFRTPQGRTITFEDVVRGRISTATSEIPDFVIQRSDGSPTYMLAVTVDDALMNITHIIRGEDLIPATPRQLLMREALGVADVPVFAHLPLLVSEQGRPLSKRWGDVSVRAYRDQGFLPEALVNYLALLGWSYDDHTNVFSVDDLVAKFSLVRVGRNPAAFDVPKLEWLNGHYIRSLPAPELAARLVPFCVASGLPADSPEGRALLEAVAPLVGERLRRLAEAPPMVAFLLGRRAPDDKAAKVLRGNEEYLGTVREALESLEDWTVASIEKVLRALAEDLGLKPRQAFQPIRAAVTGTLVSPPLFESLAILGRAETLARLTPQPVQGEPRSAAAE